MFAGLPPHRSLSSPALQGELASAPEHVPATPIRAGGIASLPGVTPSSTHSKPDEHDSAFLTAVGLGRGCTRPGAIDPHKMTPGRISCDSPLNRRQAVARIVEVRGLVKRHGATTAVSGASFTVEDSEIFPLPNHWGAVLVTLLPGAASFCALGVAVASLGEQADAAPAVVQFILFPLVFRSETYFPIHSTVLNNIASVLPLRPFNQALIGPFGRPAAQLGVVGYGSITGISSPATKASLLASKLYGQHRRHVAIQAWSAPLNQCVVPLASPILLLKEPTVPYRLL